MENLRKPSNVHPVESDPRLGFIATSAFVEQERDKQVDVSHWQLVWEHRSWLARMALRAILVSVIVAFIIPTQFESKVRIMPPESLDSSGAMLAAVVGKSNPALAAMAGNILGMKSTGALFTELLKSRTVQDHLVDRFQLQKVYWKRYKEDAREKLEKRTTIEEDRKSGVLSVTVTDHNPQRAHDLAQAYIEELNRLFAQVSTSSARRERIFIEQRLTGVKADLEDAERQFGAFASKNVTLDVKEQTRAMVESGAQLQGQLISAQSELQSLEQIYTANNVRVRATQARIDELRRQLMKVGGSEQTADHPEPQKDDELYPSIRKLPVLGVEWADLYRRVKIQETVFELLHQQYELARIQEAKEIPTVNVIDPADLPEKKSFPPRILVIALGFVLSMSAAIAWLIFSEKWRQTSSADPRKVLALEISDTVGMRLRRSSAWSFLQRMRNGHHSDSETEGAD